MSGPKHLKQIQVFEDPARFKFLLVGRRGGKTRLICEDILYNINKCPYGGEIFYIAPTNAQALELMWEPLEDRIHDMRWSCYPRVSKQRFEFSRGRKIYLIGAEKIRRIRGHKCFKNYLDELAYFETDLSAVWKAVRPTLSDLKGGCIAATTPNGKGTEAYDFHMQAISSKDWKVFKWDTVDNPYIDPAEIEDAKNQLDEKSFLQEYCAQWVSFEGMAYYNFNENLHITDCGKFDFNNNNQMFMTLDFNVNPTSLLAGQRIGNKHYFRKEYSLKNSSTIDTLKAFIADFKQYKQMVYITIHGDATGHARASTTGYSDYYYVQDALRCEGFNFSLKITAKNPDPKDRVMHMNSFLKNYYGHSRIEIDKTCKDLIRDLSSQELMGRLPDPKNNLGHKADAMGYYIYYTAIYEMRGSSTNIQL